MANVEKSTNEVFRKKYYIDAAEVLTGKKAPDKPRKYASSPIIDSSSVSVAPKPVRLRGKEKDVGDQIRVNVIRDGNKIKSIKISCPCGRHAELDCEYAPDDPKTK